MIRLLHVGFDYEDDSNPALMGSVLLQEPEMSIEDAQRLIREEYKKWNVGENKRANWDEFFVHLMKAYPQFFMPVESTHGVTVTRA